MCPTNFIKSGHVDINVALGKSFMKVKFSVKDNLSKSDDVHMCLNYNLVTS